jgi:CheY-like chemotaxis protein
MSRILIVDDEPDMRLAVRNVLKLRGYEITEAGDGPSALAMARENRPDLVLLDMRLPGMDGIEVLEGLKKIDDSLPVVMITGYGHIQSAVDVMKLGASEYLQKPFENAQLVETVKKFAHGTAVPPKRSYAVPPRELPAQYVPEPAAPRAAAPARREFPSRRRFAPLAAALAVLLCGGALYRYIKTGQEAYYREYPGVAANISAMMWRENKLVAGDWLARAIYVYEREGDNLKLADTYQLEKTHISGLAAAGETLYVADSWRKVIEARSIAPGLPLLKVFPMPGKVSAMFYDGEYLWTCDSDGNAVLRRPDSELTPAVSFRLPEKPDQIFRDGKYLWTAVSSTGRLYRHVLDDSLTLDGVFALKTLRAGYPLSAFAWKDGRVWLARDGLSVVTEAGRAELVPQE